MPVRRSYGESEYVRAHPRRTQRIATASGNPSRGISMDMQPDVDPQETREWLDAIDGVIDHEGAERAHFLIEQVIDKSRRRGAYVPFSANTAYINTIPVDRQPNMPGDPTIEGKIGKYA